ncbi:MAG: hypothetical protein WEG56_01885, partial [Chloroflexota bacterium]
LDAPSGWQERPGRSPRDRVASGGWFLLATTAGMMHAASLVLANGAFQRPPGHTLLRRDP